MRLICVTALLLLLPACAAQPIDFEKWNLSSWQVDSAQVLASRMAQVEAEMFEHHISDQGLLLYRRPDKPDPKVGYNQVLADQACWTGHLLAALSLRNHCEPTHQSASQVEKVLSGLERLHSVTGVPGLIARCVLPLDMVEMVGRKQLRWRQAQDGSTLGYRSDVSKDQYSGYIWGVVATAYLTKDASIRDRCGALLTACARHLLQHDLLLLDHEDNKTPFGDMRGRIFGAPIGVNAAIALATIQGAMHFGFLDESEMGIASRTSQKLWSDLAPLHLDFLGIRNYSNALMAASGVAALSMLPQSETHQRRMRRLFSEFLCDFSGEGNAYFYGVGELWSLQNLAERRFSLRNLLHAPLERGVFEIPKTTYENLQTRWIPSRKGGSRARRCLPLAVRPATSFRWRSDPYALVRKVNHKGELEVSGVDLFCAYWLGRYGGWVPAP